MTREELVDLADIALRDFWETIKKNLPHAQTGDVDPVLSIRLDQVARAAVVDWAAKNDRDVWTKRGSVVQIRFLAGNEGGDPTALAVVWDSDHDSFRSWASIRPLEWEKRHYLEDHGSKQPDPGLVRLRFNRESSEWLWISQVRQELPVRVTHLDEAEYRYVMRSDDVLQIREIVCNTEPIIVLATLPSDPNLSREIYQMAERLVGELNMAYYALTHG